VIPSGLVLPRRAFSVCGRLLPSLGPRRSASTYQRQDGEAHAACLLLIKRGVRVLTASGDDLTETADPSRVMMRQIAGSFSQYEKTRFVLKLRGARERIREAGHKCEGR
jgi:hypothetical protein